MENITQEVLKHYVKYDPETGYFYRIKKVTNAKIGLVVVKPSKNGYLRMNINGRLYYLHRLAWLYFYGHHPKIIDHKDGNKLNNKICNLFSVDQKHNLQNVKSSSLAKSGYKGAYFDKKTKKWQSKMTFEGVQRSLGYYATPQEAHQAYLDAKKKYHTYCPEFIR